MHGQRSVFGCPVEFTLDVLGGKWKVVLLAQLKQQPLAYGELRRRVNALSDKVLTDTLKELEASGLIHKTTLDGGRRSRYMLTERGDSLRPLLQSMHDWGLAASRGTDVIIRSVSSTA
jgi:DNA-binding HxlR family transcriptional regulator